MAGSMPSRSFAAFVETLKPGHLRSSLERMLGGVPSEEAGRDGRLIKRLSKIPGAVLDFTGGRIGSKGCATLAKVLARPDSRGFIGLDFNGCALTDDGVEFEQFADLVVALERHFQVANVDLSNNTLTKVGASAVARLVTSLPSLRVLKLDGNNLRSAGLSRLAGALEPDQHRAGRLVALSLAENNITDFQSNSKGVVALTGALRSHPTLTSLNLAHNRLTKDAMRQLAMALEVNQVLLDLNLDDNGVSDEAACNLADALGANQSLTRLSLRSNSVYSEGAVALAGAFAKCALRALDLRENIIALHGKVRLAAAVLPTHPGVVAAVEGLKDEAEADRRLRHRRSRRLADKPADGDEEEDDFSDDEEDEEGEEEQAAADAGEEAAEAAAAGAGHRAVRHLARGGEQEGKTMDGEDEAEAAAAAQELDFAAAEMVLADEVLCRVIMV